MMKNILNSDAKIEFIEPDYEGLSKVLAQFVELYKVCDNKELLDECLKSVVAPKIIHSTINGA